MDEAEAARIAVVARWGEETAAYIEMVVAREIKADRWWRRTWRWLTEDDDPHDNGGTP